MPRKKVGSPTMIREVHLRYTERLDYPALNHLTVQSPDTVAEIARLLVEDNTREHFLALYLSARHKLIAYRIVSIGTVDQSLVHPREVYQPAILTGACGVIVMHNHPSGDPLPSAEDNEVTYKLVHAGKVLSVALLDHVIWTDEKFFSYAREGRLPK